MASETEEKRHVRLKKQDKAERRLCRILRSWLRHLPTCATEARGAYSYPGCSCGLNEAITEACKEDDDG